MTSFFSSGTRCAAVLWRPADPACEPAPGVVLCHGFRGIKEWFLPDFAREFSRRGHAVLTFDYRGFGESDGQRGRLIPAEQVEDIRSALTFLGAQPWVDQDRLALYGTSFGGANVIAAAAVDERVRAVVCQVGIGDVRRAWAAPYEHLRPRLEEDRVRRALTGRGEDIDPGEILDNAQSNVAFAAAERTFPQLRQRFPLEAVERIFEFRPEAVAARIAPRAALFIGAAADHAVPVEETRHLYAAAREPKRMETFDITHYEIYDSPHRERVVDLACAWFADHLAPAANAHPEEARV